MTGSKIYDNQDVDKVHYSKKVFWWEASENDDSQWTWETYFL